MTKKFQILEATLRDGSYPINFSFTSKDTSIICKELEKAGFEYIEVGHGVGLNASNKGYGKAIQTDEEYMLAAKKVLKKAKYGMFCIPGIARLEDIELAGKYKMGFIRIGTNVTEVHKAKEFIAKAKEYNIFVTANFMKSYVLPPVEFAKKVKLVEEFGADLVYIVDSAGGMFNDDLENYYRAIRRVSDIKIGFHGHDNLGMAISNCIKAVELGIEFIDSTLQGLGRSAGNASTELLILSLIKLGYKPNIDFLKVLEIGEKYIQPLIQTKGKPVLDMVAGFADFHSSYMHFIHKYSAKYEVNPVLLIIEICKVDRVSLDEKILDKIARKIKKDKDLYLGKYNFNRYIGHEQDDIKN